MALLQLAGRAAAACPFLLPLRRVQTVTAVAEEHMGVTTGRVCDLASFTFWSYRDSVIGVGWALGQHRQLWFGMGFLSYCL